MASTGLLKALPKAKSRFQPTKGIGASIDGYHYFSAIHRIQIFHNKHIEAANPTITRSVLLPITDL